MKKVMFAVSMSAMLSLGSCASIFNGPYTEYQKIPPVVGEAPREVNWGALGFDFIIWGPLGVLVDFATGAAYHKMPKVEQRVIREQEKAQYLADREERLAEKEARKAEKKDRRNGL